MSAGHVFFWRLIPLVSGRRPIAPTLHEQVDLGHKIHIGHKVYHAVCPPVVFDNGKQDIFLGKGLKFRQIGFFDLKDLEFLILPEQAGHIGFSHQFLVVPGKRPEKRRQVFAPLPPAV